MGIVPGCGNGKAFSGKLKGVFFDMDGVLVDSGALWDHIVSTVKSEYSLDFSVLEKSDGFNLSTEEAIRLVLEDMGRYSDSLFREITERIDELYASCLGTLSSLEYGVPEILEFLRQAGVKMVLVSNSSGRQVEMMMSRYGMEAYFCGIVTSDDVSRGKPDGEPYLKALQLSGLDAGEVIVVEDSDTGVLSAVDASLAYLRVSDDGSPGDDAVGRDALGDCLRRLCGADAG